MQLIRDYEDPAEVTKQLELMGYNMGVRLVDEFCAKNRGARCRTFRETIDTVARDGFRMFLGVGAAVDGWNATSTACTLRLAENPLSDFVELPPAYAELRYSSVICGVIRGALDSVGPGCRLLSSSTLHPPCMSLLPAPPQLSLVVHCAFTKDVLNGDDATELRVELKEVKAGGAGKDYRED